MSKKPRGALAPVYLIRVGKTEWYLAWRDGEPLSWGMSREEAAEWLREHRFDARAELAILDRHGSTRPKLPRLGENRCGVGGTRLTEAQIVAYFCRGEMPKGVGVEVPA